MPFYRFQIDVNLPSQVVVERLKAIVGDKPSFWGAMTRPFRGTGTLPFIGTVQEDSFRIQRDISYRNSFLPLVWGRIEPTGTSTRVSVTMFIRPLVAVFMTSWLGMAGNFALSSPATPIAWGMVIFGIALTVGAFFPEALKAKRLICNAVDTQSYHSVSGQ